MGRHEAHVRCVEYSYTTGLFELSQIFGTVYVVIDKLSHRESVPLMVPVLAPVFMTIS